MESILNIDYIEKPYKDVMFMKDESIGRFKPLKYSLLIRKNVRSMI
jgi:hypothetical protein